MGSIEKAGAGRAGSSEKIGEGAGPDPVRPAPLFWSSPLTESLGSISAALSSPRASPVFSGCERGLISRNSGW